MLLLPERPSLYHLLVVFTIMRLRYWERNRNREFHKLSIHDYAKLITSLAVLALGEIVNNLMSCD